MPQKIVVAGFILDQGEVLLASRVKHKAIAPGAVHLPGGHVEHGETCEAALVRELAEEFGVRAEVIEPYFTFSYLTPPDSHTIGIVSLVRLLDPRDRLRPDPSETEEVLWVAEHDLPRYLAQDGHNYQAAVRGFRRWRERDSK
jgi:8-oxo-dGTP diphosphatase